MFPRHTASLSLFHVYAIPADKHPLAPFASFGNTYGHLNYEMGKFIVRKYSKPNEVDRARNHHWLERTINSV